MRGIRIGRVRSVPALAVPVLETGMEEALMLAESMDARGHGRGRRTRYRPQRWNAASITVAASACACALPFLVAIVRGGGGLAPSTIPLRWPTVSLALVVASAGLALPGFVRSGAAR